MTVEQLTLEQLLGQEGHGHKDMSGVAISEMQLRAELGQRGLTMEFDPRLEGGFIKSDGLPVRYVKSPFWRGVENDPQIHAGDIKPVYIRPKETITLEKTGSGAELEMFVWNPQTGDMAPVMAPGSPVPQWLKQHGNGNGLVEEDPIFAGLVEDAKKIGFSEEFITGCIELNFHHSPDRSQTALSMLRTLKKLDQAVTLHGWQLTPVSAFPHRPLEWEDTHPHPYIQRVSVGYMGWPHVRHYTGSSWQVHVEMLDLESALSAVNLYQLVSPLLYGVSLAAPFADGEVQPNLKELYEIDEANPDRLSDTETYVQLDHKDWHSTRYPGRKRGSPEGGVYKKPAPETMQEFLELAEQGLRDNDANSPHNIPSPARAMGHHTDRIRIDIGPHGTLEISNQDTFGGHVKKLAANQEFVRTLIWKLQYYARSGRQEELAQRYPALFTYPVNEVSLRQAHLASIEAAKYGLDAHIAGADGNTYGAKALFANLTSFVDEPLIDDERGIYYDGLPQGVLNELQVSIVTPKDIDFDKFKDEFGITSARGFYESGKGTLAHWMKQRAKELKALGLSDEQAIKNCMSDLGISYHEHIVTLKAEDVGNLFT